MFIEIQDVQIASSVSSSSCLPFFSSLMPFSLWLFLS